MLERQTCKVPGSPLQDKHCTKTRLMDSTCSIVDSKQRKGNREVSESFFTQKLYGYKHRKYSGGEWKVGQSPSLCDRRGFEHILSAIWIDLPLLNLMQKHRLWMVALHRQNRLRGYLDEQARNHCTGAGTCKNRRRFKLIKMTMSISAINSRTRSRNGPRSRLQPSGRWDNFVHLPGSLQGKHSTENEDNQERFLVNWKLGLWIKRGNQEQVRSCKLGHEARKDNREV
ncbi:MAG: hypothetical protein J3Q66DRAFT_370555 [Benniella sp.]|nr:MAG: hypothetical protein J3Q66DRAFT_370555 [Benniella sp.]